MQARRRSRSSWLAPALFLLSAPTLALAGDGTLDVSLRSSDALRTVRHWNQIAIDTSGLDHTPPGPGDPRADFAEQLGPGRSSRAMAIVHIAVFDAMNAIAGRYQSYTELPPAPRGTSVLAAVPQAAHDTLVALYPAQTAALDQQLAADLLRLGTSRGKRQGIDLGRRAAAAILALRQNDGSAHDEPLVDVDWPTSDQPGHWRQDPVSKLALALGAHWGEVAPFVLESADQFRVPAPPAMTSADYTQAYEEVKRVGGDGVATPTSRTPLQTFVGIFWAYDGTPSLCAPPRLYNQIAATLARRMRSDALETARLFALVNLAMADAGIAIWESKYHWDFWRPVTGIRESDPGTGPTGAGDGNPDTVGDPTWTPLGAPASNVSGGVDFTPPFPAYPSGHAGFGGALFQTLRRFYGRDDISFAFVSDEWNGVTRDSDGHVRPLIPRIFRSLSQAEQENGQSRIYLGIHWAFDKSEGIAQGRKVADYVFDHAFTPLHEAAERRGPSGG